MHSERELFCEKATFNINCFASVAKLVNCIFSLCFPLMLKGSWLSVTKKEPCSSSTIALREIINKVCPGWKSKWVNLPLWLLIFFCSARDETEKQLNKILFLFAGTMDCQCAVTAQCCTELLGSAADNRTDNTECDNRASHHPSTVMARYSQLLKNAKIKCIFIKYTFFLFIFPRWFPWGNAVAPSHEDEVL